MTRGTTSFAMMLLCVSLSAQAQSPTSRTTAPPTKTKHKTQEQILLEQLNEKFDKLEQLTEQYQQLQREVEDLKKQLASRDAAVQPVHPAAVPTVTPSAAAADQAQTITSLQARVDALTAKSATLESQVQADQKVMKSLENPSAIHFRGIELTPGGFLAGETVDRQRAIGGDVSTQFTGIPFAGQTAGVLSEFNASGRQSRLSLLAEGKLSSATLRGYYETDFLSAGTTSNDNQSNSYTLRLRQAWGQAALNSGWTITAGQMWSLATENKSGMTNNQEAVPLTIDAQYNAGFTWERQYGFRVVKRLSDHLWLGGALEESQTLNIGGHNLPTIVYQQAGNAGGLYNPTANYSYNYAPDLIAKAVYEDRLGHFELFGMGRFFRDRLFPDAQLAVPSALGAYTAKAQGGGIGANATVSLLNKKLDVGAHLLVGNGIGRDSTAALPDATAHADGSLELLVGGSTLGKIEWHPSSRLDLYAYYGGAPTMRRATM